MRKRGLGLSIPCADEQFPITALREIRLLKMLDDKNVITLTDMAVERGDKTARRRGAVYMITPYMDHDLSGLLENPSVTFSQAQIKCYMKQLLLGTNYLHQKHILHRDMKGNNSMRSGSSSSCKSPH